MPYSSIILELREQKAVLTLNRPEAMNAMNEQLNQEACCALEEIKENKGVDVIIITGAGRAFCAGLDLKELEEKKKLRTTGFSMLGEILRMNRPTIAAVNGFAITGGFELALSCDIIVASDKAMFADTHARVGVLPGGGLSQILPRLVGIKKAKELSFTGNYMTAQEAFQLGLVNKVVSPEELMPAAEKLADDIISADQRTVRKLKRVIDKGQGMSLEDALMMEHYEHLRHINDVEFEEMGRRRVNILERGREQAKKDS
ncbi:MAG: enoyl-CoA hydratase [Deltaproteobacteria bacterium]|nr:enoyl-CoA hydratase [Deltaproteobacteria bacterium]MBW2085218.1 enoyl-CoA hydratase [Deltaproteobacteria bacterium]